jgi:integrase
MPCHHALAEALRTYIEAAGIVEDRKGWLFRTARGHDGSTLSDKPMSQPDAWRMIRRRAAAAGIAAEIGCHTFRATGITAYLANGGALEHAQEMAAHESPRTTKLYDRTGDEVTLDEVERIAILRDQVDSEDSCRITEAALNDSAANVAQLTAPT